MRLGVSVELPLTLANLPRIKQLIKYRFDSDSAKTDKLSIFEKRLLFCGTKSQHRGAGERHKVEERDVLYEAMCTEGEGQEVEEAIGREYKTDEEVIQAFSSLISEHVVRYMETQQKPDVKVEVVICQLEAVEAYSRNISRRTFHHKSVFSTLDMDAKGLFDIMKRLEKVFVKMGFARKHIKVSYDFEDSQ